ncbi:MAG: hypothetical protein ACM3ZC_11955 [Bacteroidota bacterium]
MAQTTGTFLGARELTIFYRRWLPDAAAARANIIVVHGAAEHSGRYEYFGTRYAQKKEFAARRG